MPLLTSRTPLGLACLNSAACPGVLFQSEINTLYSYLIQKQDIKQQPSCFSAIRPLEQLVLNPLGGSTTHILHQIVLALFLFRVAAFFMFIIFGI